MSKIARAAIKAAIQEAPKCSDEELARLVVEALELAGFDLGEDDDLRDEDPAARAEREDWEDRHDGTKGAWNEPGAPFQGGDY